MILQLWGFLSYLILPIAGPYYLLRRLWRGKFRTGLRQRFGLYTSREVETLRSGEWLWIHAVSVGELQASKPLLKRMKESYPNRKLLVTTVTDTGQALAQDTPEIDAAFYLPLDLYPLCKRFLTLAQPQIAVILETELWPNIVRAVSDRNIPLFLVNARISDRSFPRYRMACGFFAPVLNRFTAIMAQSDTDRERLVEMGAVLDNVNVVGNLKFDAALGALDESRRAVWRSLFQIDDNEILLVAGSTFPGEEALLAHIAMQSTCRLLIAPRHIERIPAIQEELKSNKYDTVKRSDLDTGNIRVSKDAVLLLDTIGELSEMYSAADVVFIGKSICAKGGQNPLEPAAWGKALVFGPNMQNFRDIASMLRNGDAAKQVRNADELQQTIVDLISHTDRRTTLGHNALQIVQNNRGTAERVMQVLSPYII